VTEDKKIPGDRLVLALISAFRTLVFELSRKGVINQDEFISMLQETVTLPPTLIQLH
jgi:hypothetical protein